MTDVKFTGTSDFEKVKKDYESLAKHTAKVESENQKLKKTSDQVSESFRKTNRGQASVLEKSIGSIAQMASGYISVAGAIALVNKEMQYQKTLQDEAAQKSMTVAQSQAAVIKNIGDVPDDAVTKFIANVAKVSAEAGISSVVPTNLAASSILSAVGGDQGVTLDILRAAAPFFRDKPEEMPVFGGALGDVMKSAGGMSAKSAAALMLSIQGQARFEELGAFKEVAPALAAGNVVTRGDQQKNVRETAALFAGIGSRAGDVEAGVTKTAVANLVANLARAVPELDTTFERMEKVRGSKKLQAEVTAGGFKGSIKPIVEELLKGPDTTTAMMVADAFSKIQGSEEAFKRKGEQLRSLTPQLQLLSLGGEAEGNVERMQMDNDLLARSGKVREIVDKTLDQAHGTSFPSLKKWISKGLNRWTGLYGEEPEQAGIGMLRARRRDIKNIYDAPGAQPERLSQPDDTQKMMIELIDRQIKILETMQSESRSSANRRAQQLERQGAATE